MIYFVQAGKNGPIKIGQTSNGVEDRIAQLQSGCPYELKLLWLYTGDDFTESEIHGRFRQEKIRGEWFRPSQKLLRFIREECENCTEVNLNNSKQQVLVSEHIDGNISVSFDGGHDIVFNPKCNRVAIFIAGGQGMELFLELGHQGQSYLFRDGTIRVR